LQLAGTNLGPLQVLKNANSTILFLGYLPQALNTMGMVLVRAMGKIQSCHVHSQTHQVAKQGFGIA
jgi:hypothetical protein